MPSSEVVARRREMGRRSWRRVMEFCFWEEGG
jgi:hypothetical protein